MEYVSLVYEDVHYKFQSVVKTVPAGNTSPLNFHEGIELLYIIEGSGISHNGGDDILLAKGDIGVISPRKLHRFETTNEDCTYLLLMPDINILSTLGVIPAKQNFVKQIKDPNLAFFLQRIVEEELDRKANFRTVQFGLITVIFAELLRSYLLPNETKANRNSKYDLILPVIDYISQNYSEKLTSSMLAKQFGISQSYLCHMFTEITGQSITEYINFLRCNKVRELITLENCSVSQAAEECGFSNLSYLTRTYKRFFGTIPSKDRLQTK